MSQTVVHGLLSLALAPVIGRIHCPVLSDFYRSLFVPQIRSRIRPMWCFLLLSPLSSAFVTRLRSCNLQIRCRPWFSSLAFRPQAHVFCTWCQGFGSVVGRLGVPPYCPPLSLDLNLLGIKRRYNIFKIIQLNDMNISSGKIVRA